ncbi:MAG: hypothetical protein ACRCY3_16365 [Sphingorhabdus sp.]
MTRKIDYSQTWAVTLTLLRTHRDGVVAIAALFVFLPDWIGRLFAGQPDMEGVTTFAAYLEAFQSYYAENWPLLLATGLLGFFGGVALYVLLARKDIPTIGAVLAKALAFLPFYFIVQLAGSAMTVLGFISFIVPGLYVAGRLMPLGVVTISESERGFSGVLSRTWGMSKGNGWAIFFLTLIVAFIASLTAIIVGLMVGLVCRLIAGSNGIPFIETGVDAALATAVTVLILALSVAVYRMLGSDMDKASSPDSLSS